MLNVIINPLGRDHLPALALMPRLTTTLLTTLLLRPLTLAGATLLAGQRRIVRRRQRTVRRITLQQAIVLINPLPQRGDLRQQAEHQLNRWLTTRPRDTLRIRNTHERKIPCGLKESSRSPRPHVNAYERTGATRRSTGQVTIDTRKTDFTYSELRAGPAPILTARGATTGPPSPANISPSASPVAILKACASRALDQAPIDIRLAAAAVVG